MSTRELTARHKAAVVLTVMVLLAAWSASVCSCRSEGRATWAQASCSAPASPSWLARRCSGGSPAILSKHHVRARLHPGR